MEQRIYNEQSISMKENYAKILRKKARMRKGFAIFGAAFVLASALQGVTVVHAQENSPGVSAAKAIHPFLQKIVPPASVIAHENDLYASVMMAQAILESGWGTSRLASAPNYNLFGIKGDYQGQSVNMNTLEDSGGQNYYSIQANFRQYPSYKESLEDYAAVLRNGTNWDSLYYSGTWKSNAASYQDATSALTGRYATDSAYGSKLNGIIEKNNLTAYDTPAASTDKEKVETAPEETPVVESSFASGVAYTVRSGDSLWGIAEGHGMTLAELQALNPKVGTLIHPGEALIVRKDTTSTSVNQEPVQSIQPQEEKEPVGETTAPVQNNQAGSVTVKKGDTLYSLANQAGISVQQLKAINKLESDVIYPNQQLAVSVSTPATLETKPAATKPVAADTSASAYQVQKGDTLYSIANRAGIPVAELKAWNGLQNDTIYVGQQLNLRQAGQPASASQTVHYLVQRGDTLYSIANRTGVSVADLKAWNGLANELIYVDQQLSVQQTNQPTPAPPAKAAARYQVQKGDTLYAIARETGLSLEQLVKLNGLSSNVIYPGQALKVQ